MRHDAYTTFRCELAHAAGLGKPSDAADVRLHELDGAAVHQVEMLEAGCQPLAAGDRNRLLGAQASPGVPARLLVSTALDPYP